MFITRFATSQTFNTTNYYVQLAYRLPWQENKWKPYYRFEYIHRPDIEPVWDYTGTATVADLVGSLVGVRYDITNYAAFKGEYRNFRQAPANLVSTGRFSRPRSPFKGAMKAHRKSMCRVLLLSLMCLCCLETVVTAEP